MSVSVQPFEAISHSATDKYMRCSYFYFLSYVEKPDPFPSLDTEALVTGKACHSVLEKFYAVPAEVRAVSALTLLVDWWQDELRRLGLEPLVPALEGVAGDLQALEARASAAYHGPDAIRTKEGKPTRLFKNTTAYATAYTDLRLDKRLAPLDRAAARKDPLQWGTVSLGAVYTETFSILGNFTGPSDMGTITGIERPVEGVVLDSGIRIKGKIDLVGTSPNGSLFLGDHKTSRGEPPSALEVRYHEQLNRYAWYFERMTGERPDLLGINHLRSNQWIVAAYDPAIGEEAIARQEAVVKGIQAGVFLKQNPTDYHNACYNDFNKQACPFLSYCHPDFAKAVER